jgi:hypothetical protein
METREVEKICKRTTYFDERVSVSLCGQLCFDSLSGHP